MKKNNDYKLLRFFLFVLTLSFFAAFFLSILIFGLWIT